MHQTGEKFTAKWRITFLSAEASLMTKLFGKLLKEEALSPHFP